MTACVIESISCEAMPVLPVLMGYQGNDTKVNELRYVAEAVSELTATERETLSAFLEMKLELIFDSLHAGRSPGRISVLNVMEAIENLNYMLLDATVKSYEDVGNRGLDEAMANCQPAIDRLTSSKDESDRSFMRFVNLLHDNFDIAAYGRKMCEKGNLRLTSKGVLTVAWSMFVHRDDRDIPANYPEYAAPVAKPSILKQVEENKSVIAQTDRPDKPVKPGKDRGGIEN